MERTAMTVKREATPVDGGYAWVILIACTLSYMTLVGTCKAFGILYNEFITMYDAGAGNTAWISSLMFFLSFLLGPLANYLVGVFSFRAVVMCGGLLVSIGYFISAFVPRMEWMFLTIGIVCGVGSGLALAPCGTIVSFYFLKKRALANGILVSGSGLSSFVFPYLYRYAIDRFGVKGALIIISGLALHMCIAGALLRQPLELATTHRSPDKYTEVETNDIKLTKNQTSELKKRGNTFPVYMRLLRNTRLVMFIIVFAINVLAYAANFVAFPAHMQSLGLNQSQVTIAFSMIGAAEVFTRSLFGWFADKKYVANSTIMIFSGVLSGVAAILLPFLKTFPFMVAYGLVIGIFPGAFWSLMAVVLLDCVPLNDFTSAFGLLYTFMSFAVALSQPGMGWIEDATGSWNLSFRVMGFLHLLTAVILMSEPLIVKFCSCNQNDDEQKQSLSDIVEEENKLLHKKNSDDTLSSSCSVYHDTCESRAKSPSISDNDISLASATNASGESGEQLKVLAPIASLEDVVI
ncbi:monocarboxylate transporter 12-like isoform X1 [Mizuhopecten yessoensis]|nr:monocarboxylate transporter 12-like isoform X1 [Mizuhopecten yessoensis]XP_021378225.1 monocarboxylate transporter 12-like isoform X1 [Mizuhopecten yessoensis]XP_021378226.1 monocarboxylate transporter 12-like isoform X1 [Mizuhopecten yessoensis]